MNSTVQQLESSDYISFATRKRSGEFVPTPVWFAPDGDSYYLFSAGGAGKVKRLRNFNEVRIASCTVTGKLNGPWHDSHAYLLSSKEDCDKALAALRRKYFVMMRLGDFFSYLTGKYQRRAYIRVDRPKA